MPRISSAGFLLLAGMIPALVSVNAQTCSGTQDFSGPYVFTAVRLAYVPQSTAPPGTTQPPLVFVPQPTTAPGTTGQYSVTSVGQLVGWASNAPPFSGAGRVLADGAGVIYASRGDDIGFVRVGTYSVSNDCAIAATLNDGFTTQGDPRPGVSFQGVLTDRGNQASLVQSSLGSGVLLNFVRPLLGSGCSQLSLNGRYGLAGLGVDLTSAAVAPLTFALQLVADGAGGIGSPVGAAGYTGTYGVKSDCTGNLNLVSPDKAITRKFAFVLIAGSNTPGQLPRASALFVFDDPGKLAGIGEAR